MFDSIRKHRFFVFGFVLAWALSHRAIEGVAVAQNEDHPVPGDRIRKKLDQIISFDYSGPSFREAIAHVQDRTQMSISIDPIALQQVGVVDGAPMQIELKNVRQKVRQALLGFLQQHGLTYVVLEDNLLITTEENAVARQMMQRFPIDFKDVPAAKALRDVARQAGVNLVIDPRVAKVASANVSLELDDANVLTSMRLLAEFVDLKAVRMGNVVFVTDAPRAEKIRKEEATMPAAVDPRLGLGNLGVNVIGPIGVAAAIPGGLPPATPAQAAPEHSMTRSPGNSEVDLAIPWDRCIESAFAARLVEHRLGDEDRHVGRHRHGDRVAGPAACQSPTSSPSLRMRSFAK